MSFAGPMQAGSLQFMWLNADPETSSCAKAATMSIPVHAPAPFLPDEHTAGSQRTPKELLLPSSSEQTGGRSRLISPEVLSTDLGVGPDGFLALGAGVGAELLEAFDAAVPPLLLHVLLALQRVPAVVAVEALRHGAHGVAARPCESTAAEGTALRPWKLLQPPGAGHSSRRKDVWWWWYHTPPGSLMEQAAPVEESLKPDISHPRVKWKDARLVYLPRVMRPKHSLGVP